MFRNVDFQQSIKSMIDNAVEQRSTKTKLDTDKKFEVIEREFKSQKLPEVPTVHAALLKVVTEVKVPNEKPI